MLTISVRAQGFSLTPAMDIYARARLDRGLRKFLPAVMSAEVFLRDTNGPKGGDDKTALCVVRLRHGAVVTVESVHNDLYAAIRHSCRRAARSVRRTLGKHRRFSRDANIAEKIRRSQVAVWATPELSPIRR